MSENRVVSPADAKEIDGASRLLRLASLGEELGAPYIADDGRALAARVSEGRFYLACIGQFKRGKSTLINALIGEPVLPVGFIPVTAVPTVIRYGSAQEGPYPVSEWRMAGDRRLRPQAIRFRRAQPGKRQGSGRRGGLCPKRFALHRHVHGGYPWLRLGVSRAIRRQLRPSYPTSTQPWLSSALILRWQVRNWLSLRPWDGRFRI